MTDPKPLAVLIVDDQPDAADSLSMVVWFAGHEIKIAYTAADAIRLVTEGYIPDVILMDIGLPGRDGFDVARELCKNLPNKPLLVAVTGHSDLDKQTQQEGFKVYFVKPVDPELILGVLEGHAARLSGGD